MHQPVVTPTIEQIHRHTSVRSFRSDPVPPRPGRSHCCRRPSASSTSSNLQLWTVVAVADAAHATRGRIVRPPVAYRRGAGVPGVVRRRGGAGTGMCAARLPQEARYLENFLVAAVDMA